MSDNVSNSLNNTSAIRKPTVSYHLYVYRQQLARRNVEHLRLSKAKYHITDVLITKTVRDLKGCSIDDLKAVNRELKFKNKLKHQIHRMRKLQSLGIRNVHPNIESTEL